MIKTKLCPIAMLLTGLLWGGIAHAQEAANTAGGNGTGSGGTVAYTIGQVLYTTNTGSGGAVAQGVQHAYEIFTVGINEAEAKISLTAFPNPTADNLILQIVDYKNAMMSFHLFDLQGKQLSFGPIMAEQTQIYISNLPSGTYFINVVNQENKEVHSFKIIKN